METNEIGISRRTFLGVGPAVAALTMGFGQKDNGDPDILNIPTNYYQHFDADYSLNVPEQGFGGWKKETLQFSKKHTALVLMHAWDSGTPDQFPGWYRAVPYMPRANKICQDVLPPLLKTIRKANFNLFHVAGSGDYYKKYPGYHQVAALAGPEPPASETIEKDTTRRKLDEFHRDRVFPGTHNLPDIDRGFARLDFAEAARPLESEPVAATSRQLFELCKSRGVNHLIYAGFAVNWCLLLSPGGMADMCNRYGLMCSVIRQATTAVESRESAESELCKELALWRIALAFGFVFDLKDLTTALDAVT